MDNKGRPHSEISDAIESKQEQPGEREGLADLDCGCSLKGRSNKIRFGVMLLAFVIMVILIARGFSGAG